MELFGQADAISESRREPEKRNPVRRGGVPASHFFGRHAEAGSELRQIERGRAAVVHGDSHRPARIGCRKRRAEEIFIERRAVETAADRQEERPGAGNRIEQARPPRQGARRCNRRPIGGVLGRAGELDEERARHELADNDLHAGVFRRRHRK